LTDRRLLFLTDNLSGSEASAEIALGRAELEALWGHGEYVVIRAGDARESLGDIQPRDRVSAFTAAGPAPPGADARITQLESLAADSLGRMSGSLFRGRVTELAVDLADDERVLHMSTGKLDGTAGLLVLTNRRLFFLGEAIRRSKRREEIIPLDRIRAHAARGGLRPSLTVSLDGGSELELKPGRSEARQLNEALTHALAG
jgi:hypothetical protein